MSAQKLWRVLVLLLACGLVDAPLSAAGPANDFRGNGKSDVLWRHTSGLLVAWEMDGATVTDVQPFVPVDYAWTTVGTGDFNGDGKSDVLWRHTSGLLYLWFLDGPTILGGASLGVVGLDWSVAGIGDMNGDGTSDILWRHTSGLVYEWLLGNGTLIDHGSLGVVPIEWAVVGLSDFNGDGSADILWRHLSGAVYEWMLSGTTVIAHGGLGTVAPAWSIAGLADLNGDSRSDILWKHESGQVYGWLLDTTTIIGHGPVETIGPDWNILQLADFDGDHRADVLLRHTSGLLYQWFMNGASIVGRGSPGWVPNDWHVRPFTSAQPVDRVVGLNVSPFIDDQDPNLGATVTGAQLSERLARMARHTEWVRFFGSTHGLELGPGLAKDLGLKVACGAWIDKNTTTNAQEIAALIANGQAGRCDLAIVGSEVLRRGDRTPQELIAYITQVKQALPGLPVATADVYGQFLDHPEIIAAVDVLMPNYYPYWEGIDIRTAIAAVHAKHGLLTAAAGGKSIFVSESGWPSCGNTNGAAVPSPENQRAFAIAFKSWATANAVRYLYFEAFDETWKAKYEGPQGACWGIWTASGSLKPWMHDLFLGVLVSDNWSAPGGPGVPSIELTFVPPYGSTQDLKGQIWHVPAKDYAVAVYIRVNGGWWTKPTFDHRSTAITADGRWTTDITTGGQDELADMIAAFLVPISYTPPTASGQPALPSALGANAVALVSVTRTP